MAEATCVQCGQSSAIMLVISTLRGLERWCSECYRAADARERAEQRIPAVAARKRRGRRELG